MQGTLARMKTQSSMSMLDEESRVLGSLRHGVRIQVWRHLDACRPQNGPITLFSQPSHKDFVQIEEVGV
ncbi:hypothetical protein GJ744_006527 [Endocarpon pusillum]|uniref:Uncharacterized protein n=1 Tax=Endocarpon pusillum TaxID=364733 RepID=A0A8H7EA52_9EURO|nr:hypothetical protein GJ744_006527 [Endocarpon pusillum]